MISNKKVVVVMPAYNAGKTLEQTVAEIDRAIVDEIILVDDCSKDNTVEVARSLGLVVVQHQMNRGYGGNQKTCYRKAIEVGADVVIMLHPDYQYTPKLIPAMAGMLANNVYDVVLGSRILGGGAIKGGMPVYKYISNRCLTLVQNLMTGMKLSEYHTGYRAFTKDVLKTLPLEQNSEDFVFDNQMLLQAGFAEYRIAEITCPTKYFEEASSINFSRSVVYGFGCLWMGFQMMLAKSGLWHSRIFKNVVKRTVMTLTAGLFLFLVFMNFAEANTYRAAFVRYLPNSYENSLKQNSPSTPINVTLAKMQHETYSQLIEKLVPKVFRIAADEKHPDCNFIEDTAVIVENTAVVSRLGALERQGEEIPVAEALNALGEMKVLYLQPPATMDGGDVLYTGKHLFVGLSKRTNEHAVAQLKDIFRGKLEVVGIRVIEGLHLKSVISLFDFKTLIVASSLAGKSVQDQIQKITSIYEFVPVPDTVASNVLRIGSTLIIQEGFPQSEKILQALANRHSVELVKLNMSELIKADGALTCGSLLLE